MRNCNHTTGSHSAPVTMKSAIDSATINAGGAGVRRGLLALGRRPALPVVVIENCSRPDQRILRLTLADLAHGLDTAHGPVLVMIGEALQRRTHQSPD